MIFLDVDQVLADWTGQLLAFLSLDRAEVERRWPPHVWDVCQVITTIDPRLSSKTRIWQHIDLAGEEFWSTIKPLPWWRDVFELCASKAPTVLLTTPSKHPGSASGKLRWIQAQFGRDFDRYLIGPPKHTVARPGAVLIDDRPANCAAFAQAGGAAVLFPAHGNANVTHIGDPVGFVRDQLAELF